MLLSLKNLEVSVPISVDLRGFVVEELLRATGVQYTCTDRLVSTNQNEVDRFCSIPESDGDSERRNADFLVIEARRTDDFSTKMLVSIGYRFDSEIGERIATSVRAKLEEVGR